MAKSRPSRNNHNARIYLKTALPYNKMTKFKQEIREISLYYLLDHMRKWVRQRNYKLMENCKCFGSACSISPIPEQDYILDYSRISIPSVLQ